MNKRHSRLKRHKSRASYFWDAFIMLSMTGFVLSFGVGGLLAGEDAILHFTGIGGSQTVSGPLLLVLMLPMVVGFAIGGVAGGLLWTVVMRPFLDKKEMRRWLNYGGQPRLVRGLNERLLSLLYRQKPPPDVRDTFEETDWPPPPTPRPHP